ncbi:uncharacterized protein N7483_005353 [Penicillium malachiteum]|uniref:uncharacterized protein n=1 Tax=Penicillium malachiteum TaxID=1324776 RepID=UPI002549B2DE|nr:uncharacterized protein N7483_005353 [Penicillium malachiteum]KAJ5730845.1 hypothetical protein N7483_005353 [Penicillium malachiteum]
MNEFFSVPFANVVSIEGNSDIASEKTQVVNLNRDVLQRHQTVHEKEQGASARCQAKQIECVPKTYIPRRKSEQYSTPHMPSFSPSDQNFINRPRELMPLVQVDTPSSAQSDLSPLPTTMSYTGSSHDTQQGAITSQTHITFDEFISQGNDTAIPFSSLDQFPAFFEQVMLPNVDASHDIHETQQPRIFDLMRDNDPISLATDIFGGEFIPDLDKIFDATVPFMDFDENHPSPLDDQESANRRAAAFQRSLWLWIPEKNQHGFSEERKITLRDEDSISSTHWTRLEALRIPGILSSQTRDDIFKLVLRTAGSRLSVSAFPSSEYLDTLIKIGLGKRVETDAWIHLYTFYNPEYQQLRPELLTALIAAGCVCCGLPSISKTGIILQEITRVSLAQLVEEDNSVLRDLQYLQASMLWLDIGISCGYTRKMMIAESYLQPLCTALRRAAAFDRSTYSTITPYSLGDDEASIQRAWHSWFTLPLPAARDLWIAPTATAWRDIWTTRYRNRDLCEISLHELLSDPLLISNMPPHLDFAIAKSALLHGLALQVWEFRQQMRLSGSRATTKLWLQSRQEDLYSTLKTVQEDTPRSPPVTVLTNEFAMMYLHIDIDAIQRFIGKMGEVEARRAYPSLREWSRTKEARIAIWHAGQVLRAARSVPPYQFRGFDSLSIYQSSLVLWVYGLVECGEKRLEIRTSINDDDITPAVPLDGTEDQSAKNFLNRGIGRPGLMQHRDGHDFCELSRPRSVMAVARQVFEGNLPPPLPGDILPPMIQNLCSLIEDLGNLP